MSGQLFGLYQFYIWIIWIIWVILFIFWLYDLYRLYGQISVKCCRIFIKRFCCGAMYGSSRPEVGDSCKVEFDGKGLCYIGGMRIHSETSCSPVPNWAQPGPKLAHPGPKLTHPGPNSRILVQNWVHSSSNFNAYGLVNVWRFGKGTHLSSKLDTFRSKTCASQSQTRASELKTVP